MTNNTTKTTNGMTTNISSLNANVDLFFKIGASRGKDIIPSFEKAYSESPDTALRVAQWARDVRGGSGERTLYKSILSHLASTDADACRCLMVKTPELGRWDDLLVLVGTPLENDAFAVIKHGLLTEKNPLCGKWMPRKGPVSVKLRTYMEMSPKRYRKTLVTLTNVVETAMCSKSWDDIDFAKLPSVASARYQNAFNRNASVAYAKYKELLVKNETTINAGAVYPYDIIKSLKNGDHVVANKQWDSLPDYIGDSTERIVPVVDTSGSMSCSAGGSDATTCIDVAISLGLYIAERGKSIFKDNFITFSSDPQLQRLDGTLNERYKSLLMADWGMSTNIVSVFKLILDAGILYSVPETEMPTKIVILSDMQFDVAGGRNIDKSAMTMIKEVYNEAGYVCPDIIFWNIRDSGGVPVSFNELGVGLVSGFSPAIMKSVISCSDIDPMSIMMETINDPRYDWE